MRTNAKIIACLLCLSIFMTAISCTPASDTGSNTPNETQLTTDPNSGTQDSVDKWGRPVIESSLPNGLDFGGETVNILVRSNSFYSFSDYFVREMFVEEDSGEVVDSSIYNRNKNVEELLNVKLNVIPMENAQDEGMHNALIKSVLAGLNEYDLIAGYQYYFPKVATQNVLYNLKQAPYLDFSKQWWLSSLMDELTIGDKLFYMSGDISQSMVKGAYALFFNKRLYGEYAEEDIYQIVINGDWTYDKLIQIAKTTYKDINGDGKKDDSDLYAFGTHTGSMIDSLTASCEIRYTEKDSDGYPTYVLNSERNMNLLQKLYTLLFETDGSIALPPTSESSELLMKKFGEGTLMFLPTILLNSERFRNMEDDYGIIPLPKLDKNQDRYMGATIDNSSLFAIAGNVKNIDLVAAVTEALCAESYRSVTPVYYEVALKQKYTRDDTSSQMVDIIRDGIYYDFGLLYSSSLDNVGHTPRQIYQSKNKAFTSVIEKTQDSVSKKISDLVDKYNELG